MANLSKSRRSPSIVLFTFVLFLAVVAGCGDDDDDPVGPWVPVTEISGKVVGPDGRPASGAMVYLGVFPFVRIPTAPSIIDSVLTDDSGLYAFTDLNPGYFQVYAGVWNGMGDDFAEVSPFSPRIRIGDKVSNWPVNLALQPLQSDGVVAGSVYFQEGPRLVPADSTEIMLYRYLGAGSVLEAEGLTNEEGEYTLPGIQTGNCGVVATKVISSDAPFPLFLTANSEVFFGTGDDLAKVEDLILYDTLVEKPAVYIYPREAGVFKVELAMGPGVRLTASEPDYGAGWSVFVDRAGRIDRTWDYLFYEVGLRGAPRIDTGWCLVWEELFPGLNQITAELGLNEAERQDFLVYWRERLPRRNYYEIHPVLGIDLDPWVELNIDPAPETSLRFWLFFEGRDQGSELVPPRIQPVARVGTTVVEWGGAILP